MWKQRTSDAAMEELPSVLQFSTPMAQGYAPAIRTRVILPEGGSVLVVNVT